MARKVGTFRTSDCSSNSWPGEKPFETLDDGHVRLTETRFGGFPTPTARKLARLECGLDARDGVFEDHSSPSGCKAPK